MTTPIHPDAIRAFRERKRWTQEKLAKAAKVSLPTIKRIEGKKDGMYAANTKKAEAIGNALGVTLADLAAAPSPEIDRDERLRKQGYRPLRTMIDAETALAFNMVQHIYGIPIPSQVVMAPLFAALLAEGSLAWRRERVAEIEEAASRLMSLGGGHFSFANAAYRSLNGAAEEQDSISMQDLFGEHIGSDAFDFGYKPSQNNPFADFLNHFARQVGAKTISFERGSGWKTSEGMPEYRIGAELISDLTGDDPDAEYALLRGHVRLKDIPADLLGDEHVADRITWIVGRIPEELERRRVEHAEFLALLDDLDVPTATGASDEREENGDA